MAIVSVMTRFSHVVTLVIGLLAGVAVGLFIFPGSAVDITPGDSVVTLGTADTVINFGDGDVLVCNNQTTESATAFSLLELCMTDRGVQFEHESYEGLGVLVSSIAGRAAGTDNAYWQYWVNGEYAQVASDMLEVSPGDLIEWTFTASGFE